MLLNGIHLLPDPSGAIVWPKRRLLAVSDPLVPGERDAAPGASAALARLAAVLRHRRPATVIWLGSRLAQAVAEDRLSRREKAELSRMVADHACVWVGEDLPAGLPGQSAPEWQEGPLTFRAIGHPDAGPGEISATPWPLATVHEGGRSSTLPCYVIDGRRLVLPALGPRATGVDVVSPQFPALFRRTFHVLLLSGARILTRPRARLARQ